MLFYITERYPSEFVGIKTLGIGILGIKMWGNDLEQQAADPVYVSKNYGPGSRGQKVEIIN